MLLPTVPNLNWLCDSLVRGHPVSDATGYNASRNAEPIYGFGHTHSHPRDSDDPVISCVSPLLLLGRPVAVVLRVWAVVISSIKRRSKRALPHVGEELSEIPPLPANRYPAPAVPMKVRSTWLLTPAVHVNPYLIFRGPRKSMGSVLSRQGGDVLPTLASARCRSARTEVTCAGSKVGRPARAGTSRPLRFAVRYGQAVINTSRNNCSPPFAYLCLPTPTRNYSPRSKCRAVRKNVLRITARTFAQRHSVSLTYYGELSVCRV